MTNHRIRSH